MVEVNKLELSDNKRHLPYGENLEEFLNLVALAKPLCSFAVDNKCVNNHWIRNVNGESEYSETISTINVYEDGEAIGSISVAMRYRAGGKERVYGVESFRIHKERGDRNTTYVKDIKVAMRNVKKFFTGRQDNELKDLITGNVTHGMNRVMQDVVNSITWSVDTREVAFNYVMKAYDAHKQGQNFVHMPVKIHKVKDHDSLFNKCESVLQSKTLEDRFQSKQGYGVHVRQDNSIVIYSYALDKVSKYPSFDEVPTEIQTKLGMFKVLDSYDAYADFGIKFDDGFFYIP